MDKEMLEMITKIQEQQLKALQIQKENKKGCIERFFDAVEAHPVATLAVVITAAVAAECIIISKTANRE